jgi:predicted nucleic acid-binding protein
LRQRYVSRGAAALRRAALERAGTPIGPYDLLIAAQVRRRSATRS